MFINLSNHPSKMWCIKQKVAAARYGAIEDYPFPNVDTGMNTDDVSQLATAVCKDILRLKPAAVMCQGEFTLAFSIISKLLENGITVVAACTERTVNEIIDDEGNPVKQIIFRFAGFREYDV